MKTPTWRRWMALGASALALSLTACSNDDENALDVSPEARESALASTEQVVEAERLLETAQLVEDLTGGFDQGLAGESSGLEMEFGGQLGTDGQLGQDASTGAWIARAYRDLQPARTRLEDTPAFAKAPGDLLFEFTETNLDGSTVVTRVYQDEPESVVRVTQDTTWPNGNLLLTAMRNEIFVDRGADYESEADDIWLSLASALEFHGGQRLERAIDAREQGGLQDDLRVEVVSTFLPRPNHPRLVDAVTTLEVDLHQLDDEADDRFVSIDRVTRFRGVAHDGNEPRVVESLTPESPLAEGEEPCGGVASREIHFEASSALRRLTDAASETCEGAGSLSREVLYADNTSDSMSITRDAQGVVTLDLDGRDGTQTDGTFDEASGQFSITTQYPQGSDPVSESLSGQSNAAGTDWSLDATVVYADGFEETGHLEGVEDEDGKSLSGDHTGRDGSFSFSLATNADETVLEGHLENDQDQVLDFRAEELADGSRLLDFTAVDPPVRVEGHVEVGADGCGVIELVVTEGDARTEIRSEFCDGELAEDDFLAGL